MKRWTNTELIEIEKVRRDWLESNRMGVSPHFEEVKVGDTLPRRVIGPHTIASFTTEYRAFLFKPDVDELARGVEVAVARLVACSKRRRASSDHRGLSLVVSA